MMVIGFMAVCLVNFIRLNSDNAIFLYQNLFEIIL